MISSRIGSILSRGGSSEHIEEQKEVKKANDRSSFAPNYSFEMAKPVEPHTQDDISAQIQLAVLNLSKNLQESKQPGNPEILKVIGHVQNFFKCYNGDPSQIKFENQVEHLETLN